MRAAFLACAVALVSCDDATPVVGDAPADAVVDAWMSVDGPACDRVFFDAGPGPRCQDGEIIECPELIPPACDAWGCCPFPIVIDAEHNRCCKVFILTNSGEAPCCRPETLALPEACPRCEFDGVPPW